MAWTPPPPPSAPPSKTPRNYSNQGDSLDFKQLSKYAAIVGIGLICGGGFIILKNLPLPPPPEPSQNFNMREFVEMSSNPTKNIFDVYLLNQDREFARARAYKSIAVGALINFMAFAINRSSRRVT